MINNMRMLLNRRHPKRGLGLLVGGLIVVGGSMLAAQTRGDKNTEDVQTPAIVSEIPDLPECSGEEAAGKVYVLLRERHVELRNRELVLDREQAEIAEERRSLGRKLDELHQLRTEIDRRISDWDKQNGAERADRLNHLVGILEQMTPAGAGELLLQTDRSLAVEVMAKLEPRVAADILSTLPASQAAEFADALTVRRPF